MLAVGVFWMFMWLVGANGYSERKGTIILGGNLVLAIFFVIITSAASGWLASKFASRTTLSIWLIAPLTILTVTAASVAAMFVGSLIIIAIVGSTR
jgi:hypothetical protein